MSALSRHTLLTRSDEMVYKKSEWIMYGILGVLFFGLFGFLVKFSTLEPYVANFVIQFLSFVATIFIYIFFLRKESVSFSKSGALAGFFGSMGTLILLYTVSENQLIVTYPFASMACFVFLIINYIVYKLRFEAKQFLVILTGLSISSFGLFLAVAGSTGGLSILLSNIGASAGFVLFGLGIMFFWGVMSFFFFKGLVKDKTNIASFLISMTASIALTAFANMLILQQGSIVFDNSLIYPVFSGIFVAFGSYFIAKGYKVSNPKSKVQSLILAIFATSDIIPVTILALLILNEYSPEALLGVVFTIIGITLINYSESV